MNTQLISKGVSVLESLKRINQLFESVLSESDDDRIKVEPIDEYSPDIISFIFEVYTALIDLNTGKKILQISENDINVIESKFKDFVTDLVVKIEEGAITTLYGLKEIAESIISKHAKSPETAALELYNIISESLIRNSDKVKNILFEEYSINENNTNTDDNDIMKEVQIKDFLLEATSHLSAIVLLETILGRIPTYQIYSGFLEYIKNPDIIKEDDEAMLKVELFKEAVELFKETYKIFDKYKAEKINIDDTEFNKIFS